MWSRIRKRVQNMKYFILISGNSCSAVPIKDFLYEYTFFWVEEKKREDEKIYPKHEGIQVP